MQSSKFDIIPSVNTKQWHQVLDETDSFDSYHLPEYHQVAEKNGEGAGVLFVY